jgi:hypothetical protein
MAPAHEETTHMFVHAVYFWGQADLSDADKQEWLKGLRTLPGIETVYQGYVGVPADTHRDVVVRNRKHR